MKEKSNAKKWICIGLVWLAIWQAVSMAVADGLILPGPLDTVKGLISLLGEGSFYMDALATIYRCVAAMILSMVAGTALSVCAYRWNLVRDMLALPVAFFKSVPIMAVAIYMLLLLSSGNVPIVVCFIMCFPIVYTNLLAGLDGMDLKILEMADMYGITGRRRMRYIYLPQLFSHFKAALAIITGVSWKAIVTAEVLSIPEFSLGYELMNSKYYLETDLLFAYVAVIVLLSIAFEKLVKLVLSKLQPAAYEGSRVKKMPLPSDCAEQKDIVVSGVSKSFGDKKVLDDVSMTIEKGRTTAVMGPSGKGKTTLGRIICGLDREYEGDVTPARVSVLFQEERLLPWLNVHDNLALVSGDTDKMKSMLESAGLSECEYMMPDGLSGGMAHRIAMIRMLLHAEGTDLILADEPFRGLDSETRENVIEHLWKPNVEKKTVLMITHSEDDAETLADRIIEM